MPPDKYRATWVSYSSIGDFLTCPRSYYLRNMYKDPASGRKIDLVKPALSLGQIVHEVLEGLVSVPAGSRFSSSLVEKYEMAWVKVSGEKGGFDNRREENDFRARGRVMIERVENSPGPLANKAVRMNQDLPHYFLSEEDNIILCGKVDWLEHVPVDDSVHVIDFKTGRSEVRAGSLQLPIYSLLLVNCQKRKVSKASYWYLGREDGLKEIPLPDEEEAQQRVLQIARRVKRAREEQQLTCPRGAAGCYACGPFEAICRGEGRLVGQGLYNKDVYFLPEPLRARSGE